MLGGGILYWLYIRQDKAFQEDCVIRNIGAEDCSLLTKVLTDIQGADYRWIFLVLFLFFISNVFRALRWKMLINPLGVQVRFINCFLCVMLGYFANLALPRMGEFVRAVSFTRVEDVSMSKVFGTIVTDRVIDFISLGIVILLALAFEMDLLWGFIRENLDLQERFNPYLLGFLFLVMLAGAYVLWYLVMRSKTENKLILKLRALWLGFRKGLRSFRDIKNPGLFLVYSIGIWLMYYLMTYICFAAFEPTEHLTPVAGLVVFVFGTLGIVFPSPGGMGSYHFLIIEALKIYGIAELSAFTFANLIFFTIQIGGNVLFGILALILLPIINNKIKRNDG